ncbi:MAG TPA: four helix bundle protein [Chitinophagales bacterium]|nr:four helix bundle protein [Chitinophagales bacterium]
MLTLNHKNLEVWKQSMQLVKIVYLLTKQLPKEEQFGLISQMRRASVSVCSNIAEGASRKTEPDRKKFYMIARSSLVELDTQIEISLGLSFLTEADIEQLKPLTISVFRILSTFIKPD